MRLRRIVAFSTYVVAALALWLVSLALVARGESAGWAIFVPLLAYSASLFAVNEYREIQTVRERTERFDRFLEEIESHRRFVEKLGKHEHPNGSNPS